MERGKERKRKRERLDLFILSLESSKLAYNRFDIFIARINLYWTLEVGCSMLRGRNTVTRKLGRDHLRNKLKPGKAGSVHKFRIAVF